MKQLQCPSTLNVSGFDHVIYTDGGCHNNPPRKGDGAWAFVDFKDGIIDESNIIVHCGCMMDTTNNRAEMVAVINGILNCGGGSKIMVISDSGYVVKGYNHPSYLDTWIRNGWHTASGDDVKNVDLWKLLNSLAYHNGIKFKLIKGHYKDPNSTHAYFNSIVDRACTHIIQNNIIGEHVTLKYNPNGGKQVWTN